jgi:calpain-15
MVCLQDEYADDCKWRGIVSLGQLWQDAEFPATKDSIDGPPAPESAKAVDSEQRCRCGVLARKSVVGKDTPNKGRPYFHCEMRRCGFFNWADNKRSSWKNYDWRRFPSFVIVSDFGFSAEHLRQGGVGDCWFLSALAVVAERHDLIAKLFKDTSSNGAGCYNVRLFLDGAWQPVLIDDRLPCTKDPRRPEHVFDSGLAFSRAANSQV